MTELYTGSETLEEGTTMNDSNGYDIGMGAEEVETKPKKAKKVKKMKKKAKQEPKEEVEVEVQTVQAEIVSHVDEPRVSKMSDIQSRIIGLNDEADAITTQALSNAKTSDLTEHQETLIAAIMSIQEATGENIDDDEGMISGLWGKFTSSFGLAKKIQKTVQEKFIENASLQENIDSIFEALEGSIVATEQDMGTLANLQNSLTNSVNVGAELVAELEAELLEFGDSNDDLMDKAKVEGLLRELKSINLVNTNTANQIKAQVSMTTGMASQLREVRPILKNLIKSQTLVALQNARMGQAKEVRDLVSGVVNDFVTKNNANTNATILDAIEYSGKTVIAQETVEELGTQHDVFVKELQFIVKDLNKQKLAYNKTVDKVTQQLGAGLSELPRLMAGETSDNNSIGYTGSTGTTGPR